MAWARVLLALAALLPVVQGARPFKGRKQQALGTDVHENQSTVLMTVESDGSAHEEFVHELHGPETPRHVLCTAVKGLDCGIHTRVDFWLGEEGKACVKDSIGNSFLGFMKLSKQCVDPQGNPFSGLSNDRMDVTVGGKMLKCCLCPPGSEWSALEKRCMCSSKGAAPIAARKGMCPASADDAAIEEALTMMQSQRDSRATTAINQELERLSENIAGLMTMTTGSTQNRTAAKQLEELRKQEAQLQAARAMPAKKEVELATVYCKCHREIDELASPFPILTSKWRNVPVRMGLGVKVAGLGYINGLAVESLKVQQLHTSLKLEMEEQTGLRLTLEPIADKSETLRVAIDGLTLWIDGKETTIHHKNFRSGAAEGDAYVLELGAKLHGSDTLADIGKYRSALNMEFETTHWKVNQMRSSNTTFAAAGVVGALDSSTVANSARGLIEWLVRDIISKKLFAAIGKSFGHLAMQTVSQSGIEVFPLQVDLSSIETSGDNVVQLRVGVKAGGIEPGKTEIMPGLMLPTITGDPVLTVEGDTLNFNLMATSELALGTALEDQTMQKNMATLAEASSRRETITFDTRPFGFHADEGMAAKGYYLESVEGLAEVLKVQPGWRVVSVNGNSGCSTVDACRALLTAEDLTLPATLEFETRTYYGVLMKMKEIEDTPQSTQATGTLATTCTSPGKTEWKLSGAASAVKGIASWGYSVYSYLRPTGTIPSTASSATFAVDAGEERVTLEVGLINKWTEQNPGFPYILQRTPQNGNPKYTIVGLRSLSLAIAGTLDATVTADKVELTGTLHLTRFAIADLHYDEFDHLKDTWSRVSYISRMDLQSVEIKVPLEVAVTIIMQEELVETCATITGAVTIETSGYWTGSIVKQLSDLINMKGLLETYIEQALHPLMSRIITPLRVKGVQGMTLRLDVDTARAGVDVSSSVIVTAEGTALFSKLGDIQSSGAAMAPPIETLNAAKEQEVGNGWWQLRKLFADSSRDAGRTKLSLPPSDWLRKGWVFAINDMITGLTLKASINPHATDTTKVLEADGTIKLNINGIIQAFANDAGQWDMGEHAAAMALVKLRKTSITSTEYVDKWEAVLSCGTLHFVEPKKPGTTGLIVNRESKAFAVDLTGRGLDGSTIVAMANNDEKKCTSSDTGYKLKGPKSSILLVDTTEEFRICVPTGSVLDAGINYELSRAAKIEELMTGEATRSTYTKSTAWSTLGSQLRTEAFVWRPGSVPMTEGACGNEIERCGKYFPCQGVALKEEEQRCDFLSVEDVDQNAGTPLIKKEWNFGPPQEWGAGR